MSQSFGVYPALSMRAAYAPPNRRWRMILNALVEKLKRRSKDDFKGLHFEATLILQAVSWYLRYPLSYRDIAVARHCFQLGPVQDRDLGALGRDQPAILKNLQGHSHTGSAHAQHQGQELVGGGQIPPRPPGRGTSATSARDAAQGCGSRSIARFDPFGS